jgi:hypothetical protein
MKYRMRRSERQIEDHDKKLEGLDVLISHLENKPEIIKARLPQERHQIKAMTIWKLQIS